jgi:deazaflavin-dependent oxidoreductase (nitroreductase family)
MAIRFVRSFLKIINTVLMVPLFRLGLGPIVGNPITGYIMVVKTTGRKTGKPRYAPVNYAIQGGKIYCMAGFGKRTHWYLNLQSQTKIEMITPGGSFTGTAEINTDINEALLAIRQLLKNSGFAGFLAGFNPYRMTDDQLRKRMERFPLVGIRPTGLVSGPGDAGGTLWILTTIIVAYHIWRILR